MPTSKPFSASSFADSCPIPESEAVTIATGLMLSPLVPKEYAHPALCPRSEEHKQNTRMKEAGGALTGDKGKKREGRSDQRKGRAKQKKGDHQEHHHLQHHNVALQTLPP